MQCSLEGHRELQWRQAVKGLLHIFTEVNFAIEAVRTPELARSSHFAGMAQDTYFRQ